MDVDQTLKDMLDIAHSLQDGEALDPRGASEDLATLVIELDHWLSRVGFLPSRWAYGRDAS